MWVKECNCCLWGIDLRMGAAVHRSCGTGIKKTTCCYLCAYGKTHLIHISLFMLFCVWYFASCVAHLQQSPTNSLLYAWRRQLSAAQRKVFEIFLHPATAWRSNVCHSAGLLPGIRHAVFPGKLVKQWGGQKSWAKRESGSVMYLQLSFQLALPEPLPPRFLRGTLGKSQPGHELDGKGKGWREKMERWADRM